MSEKYKARNPEGVYFITITVVDWLDLFTRPVYKHIIVDSIIYCQENKGLVVYGYVLMTSHIHMIVKTENENALSEVIRDFKTFTSKKLIEAIIEYPESRRELLLEKFSNAANKIKRNKNYKVWQDGYHPVELIDNKMIEQKLKYIHNNPVEEEIVLNAEEYKYSSAVDYNAGNSDIKIEML